MKKIDKILYYVDPIDGYKEEIENELKKNFGEVTFIKGDFPKKEDRSKSFKVLRELEKISFFKKFFLKRKDEYMDELLKNIVDYDYFLTIGTGEFSVGFLKKLRAKNPNIKTILFLWDKVKYLPKKFNLKGFDYVFSFDKEDCKEHNFIFRESFYIESKDKENYEKQNDIYYLGAMREESRYKKLVKLKKYFEKNNFKFKLKLYVDKNLEKKIENKLDEDLIIRKKVGYLENLSEVYNSKCIIEINYKNQNGLTLRSMESILGKTKLITDNPNIKEYDFYNKNNIYIIGDIDEIEKIPLDFFDKEYEELPKDIVEKYSCKGFLETIFKKINYQGYER